MDSFFVRYRNIVVLLVILLAQIIGLATQVRRTDSGHNALNPRDDRGRAPDPVMGECAGFAA